MYRSLHPSLRSLFALPALGLLLVSCGGATDVGFVGSQGAAGAPGSPGTPGASGCGDGVVADTESCDDGNRKSADGCSNDCKSEPGFVCPGAPSVCAFTCNNGKLDEGEVCEDANLLAGDGCDANCQVEGSCEKPAVLTLDGKDGVFTAKVDSSTAGGGSAVAASACGSDEGGAGPDRVFEIELLQDADLNLRVEAAFNAILRVLKKPCSAEAGDELTCENEVGAGATESLLLPDLPAGKYYLVVDGASANAKGDFTLSASASCPASNIQLNRVNFASTQVELRNTGTCPVNLKNIGYRVENSGAGQSYALPNRVIGPKKSFTVASYAAAGFDDYVLTPSVNAYSTTGAISLCRGPCVAGDGSNVFDFFRSGASAPALPEGITFSPEALTAINSYTYTSYYVRVARKGAAPDFQASDWRPTFILDPDLNPLPYLYPVGTTASETVAEDPDEGKVLRIANTGEYSFAGRNIFLEPVFEKPKYISFRFKDDLADSGCYVGLGVEGTGTSESTTWSQFSTRAGYSYLSSGKEIGFVGAGTVSTPITANVWHQLEYRNIDWTAGTFDRWIDGAEAQAGVSFKSGHSGSINIINVMPYTEKTCTFNDFVVY